MAKAIVPTEPPVEWIDGVPVFHAYSYGGPFKQVKRRDGTAAPDGCYLIFTCPRCGKENAHGGYHEKPGMGDGHRVSHCECWPNGYYLRESGPAAVSRTMREILEAHSTQAPLVTYDEENDCIEFVGVGDYWVAMDRCRTPRDACE